MKALDELLKYAVDVVADFPLLQDRITRICWEARAKSSQDKDREKSIYLLAKGKIKSLVVELSYPS